MSYRTLRDYLVERTINGTPIYDELEKSHGILLSMPIIAANRGKQHIVKKATAVPSAAIRTIGGSVMPTTTNNQLLTQDLHEFTTLQREDWNIVKSLSGAQIQAYFSETYPEYLEGMMQKITKQIIYGTNSTFGDDTGFKGLHEYAKAASKVVQKDGTSGSRTSIFAVRWNPKFTAGLVNANFMSGGQEFMMSETPRRVDVITNVTTGATLPTYSSLHSAEMGLLCNSNVSVAAITQIDSSNLPTVANLQTILRYVHSSRGNTFIYCNEQGYDYIGLLKDSNLQAFSETKDYNTLVDTFNNCPIIVDENILSTETTVLD